jgi:ribosomal protein L40E
MKDNTYCDHDFGNQILASNPPQQRCIKCGYTTIRGNIPSPRQEFRCSHVEELKRLTQLIREKDQVIMDLQKSLANAYKPQIIIEGSGGGHGFNPHPGGAGGFGRLESIICNHDFSGIQGSLIPICRNCGAQRSINWTSQS